MMKDEEAQVGATPVKETPTAAEEPAVPVRLRKRVQVMSDLTGMNIAEVSGALVVTQAHSRLPRVDRKTVQDMTILLNMKPEAIIAQQGRRRQISSTDVIKKFAQANQLRGDDLRLAEEVAAFGTAKERQEKGEDEQSIVEHIERDEHHAGDVPPDGFEYNHEGLTSDEAAKRLQKYGPNELPEHVDPKWLIFLRQFWAPMPIMIWIAILVEAAILNWLDMGILLFIQFTNASISFYETTKAGDAVAALKSSLKPTATVKRDGKWKNIDGREVVPGDTVLLASGSAVPADCRVNHSEIDVDQAALTGESLPVTMYKGDSCKMGSTVVRGEVEGTVEFTGAETFFGKTASLLEEKHELSHLQKILMQIMIVLVAMSILLSGIYFVYLLAEGVHLKEALSFTVVVLVASIPLAIEIVTTTTLAIGSKDLVKHGAIVAKLSAIEDMAGMSILCSDKTGTLTLNKMVLQDDTPMYSKGETQATILMYAAMAAKWKEPPRDALDRLTLGSVNFSLLDPYEQKDYIPFDPTTKRTEGTVMDTRTKEVFKTTKGAPHIIMALLPKDDIEVKDKVEADVSRLGAQGIRSLAVARTFPGSDRWHMMGLLTFMDPPRGDTKDTISQANHYGVDVKMITGDHLLIARNTAKQLDMGDRIFTADRLPLLDPETKQKPDKLSETYGDLCLMANGFAQVYPEHKYLIVECLRELHYTVGMTGDGVNDAPALKRADIGIAVAGATDAARAAADIVLTEEGLGTIIHGILIARAIFQRINNFITYRIAATLQLLVFFFISIFAFKPSDYEQPEELDHDLDWPEHFHVPVIMLMLITLLNDGTLITIAYDHAEASATPNKWNLPALFVTSSSLGFVSCVSSLVLLHFLLDSWNPDGFLHKLGIGGLQYGQIITAIYLKISVSDFLTLFSARTGSRFFWQVKPAAALFIGGCLALLVSSILSIFWPDSNIDGILVLGLKSDIAVFFFVWIFSIIFFFIQDGLKVGLFIWMHKVNFANIAQTGVLVLPESAQKLIDDMNTNLKEAGVEVDC